MDFIKKIFGIESEEEKRQSYVNLLTEKQNINNEIKTLGECWDLKKSEMDYLSDDKKKAFLEDQAQRTADLMKRNKDLEKSLLKYESDEQFKEEARNIKKDFMLKSNYQLGLIPKNDYFNILKAKNGGKVKYADILVRKFCEGGSQILILQRAGDNGEYTSQWCIPGGHVDPGESFIEAAVRELYEETGIKVREGDLREVSSYTNDDADIHYFELIWNEDCPDLILLDSKEEIGSEWIDIKDIDNYEFIFDMKKNLKKILGIDEEALSRFKIILKAFSEGKISKEKFDEYCDRNEDLLVKNGYRKKKLKKTMDTGDSQTLAKESLDGKKKGPEGDGIDRKDENIEKAITFKTTQYEEKEVVAEPSKWRNGKVEFFVNDNNEGKEIEKIADILAIIEKLTQYGDSENKFKIKIETEDNGEQEWKFEKGFYISSVTKEERIQKSEKDELSIQKSGIDLVLNFSDAEEADFIKSMMEELNNEGKINLTKEPELNDNSIEKAEDKNKSIFRDYMNFIEGFKTRIKNIHWTEENKSKHEYLDDLSGELGEYEDKLAEAGQSQFGRFKDGEIKGEEIDEDDPIKIVGLLYERTKEFRHKLEGDDNFLGEISWIDDFLANLKQTKYRLELH